MAEREQRYIRWVWRNASRPFPALWKWANQRQKIVRFRSLQKWAAYMQEHAKRADKRALFRRKHYEYKAKADSLSQPKTGCGSPGAPDWAGCASICEREVVPVFERRGVPITSRKRTSTLGNPSSDHYVGNTSAYAVDAGTYYGVDDALAVANALGISGYSVGNYNGYTIRRCGHSFRVQILWAVPGHHDHVHVGVRRI